MAMPKRVLQRYIPSPEKIASIKGLGFLRHRLADPSLWHLNRRSASGAVFCGLWCAFLPMPFHTVIAVMVAVLFRFHLPLCVLLVWVNNPFTLIPIIYASFFVGSHLLSPDHALAVPSLIDIEHIIANLFMQSTPAIHSPHLSTYVEAILLGMLVIGFVLACLGYMVMNRYWHYRVLKRWQKRHNVQKSYDK